MDSKNVASLRFTYAEMLGRPDVYPWLSREAIPSVDCNDSDAEEKICRGTLRDGGRVYQSIDNVIRSNPSRLLVSANLAQLTIPVAGVPPRSIRISKNLRDGTIYLNIYQNDGYFRKSSTLGLFNFRAGDSATEYEIALHLPIATEEAILDGKTTPEGIALCNAFIASISETSQSPLQLKDCYDWDMNLDALFMPVKVPPAERSTFFDYDTIYEEYRNTIGRQPRRPGSNDVVIKSVPRKIYTDLLGVAMSNDVVSNKLMEGDSPRVYLRRYPLSSSCGEFSLKISVFLESYNRIGNIALEFCDSTGKTLGSMVSQPGHAPGASELMLVLSDDRGKFQFSTLGIKILNAFLFYANFYDGHLRLENPSSFDFMLIPPPEWSTGAEALDYASKLN